MSDLHRCRVAIRRWKPGATSGLAVADLPPDVATALGGLKQQRVTGTMQGAAFTSSVMPAGYGVLCLSVSKAMMDAAGVTVGDEVDVEVGCARERTDRGRQIRTRCRRRAGTLASSVDARGTLGAAANAGPHGVIRDVPRQGGMTMTDAVRRRPVLVALLLAAVAVGACSPGTASPVGLGGGGRRPRRARPGSGPVERRPTRRPSTLCRTRRTTRSPSTRTERSTPRPTATRCRGRNSPVPTAPSPLRLDRARWPPGPRARKATSSSRSLARRAHG